MHPSVRIKKEINVKRVLALKQFLIYTTKCSGTNCRHESWGPKVSQILYGANWSVNILVGNVKCNKERKVNISLKNVNKRDW